MVDVRQADAADSQAITALLAQLGYEAAPDEVRRRLGAGALAERVLLARAGGDRVVGLVAYSPPIERIAEGSPSVRITALVVHEDWRTKSIGRALVEEVERRAAAEGAALVEVTSSRQANRNAAHAFYPRMGYVDVSARSALYRKALR